MAGEALVRACFPQKRSKCRICGARVNLRSGARLAHAATHLQRLQQVTHQHAELRKHQIEHLGQ